MAVQTNVPGAALVKVGGGAVGSLSSLGYSMNGIQISEQNLLMPIYGDVNGGDAGAPVDWQIMGIVHTINMELHSYDESIADALRRIASATALGIVPTSGTLYTAGTALRLVIASTSYPRNYPSVIISEPIEVNKGTKYSILRLSAKAWGGSGATLWNTTTS